jgi:hypothetical protein
VARRLLFRRFVREIAIVSLLLSIGCDGAILEPREPGVASVPTIPGDDATSPSDDEPTIPGDPFALDRESPRLLPFETRLARVAAVAGIAVSDPLLDPMRDQAIALGGYDHSRGILPDSSWNATRIAIWVRTLRPVCRSEAMRTQYPSLPDGDLDALIEAAWGRAATDTDRAEIASTIGALPEPVRHESTCLAVLASAETVLQ